MPAVIRPLLAIALASLALPVAGDESNSAKGDHTLVLTRTVQPRVAYRALPAQENPSAASVSTFPSRVFHTTIDTATSQVGDQLLGDTFGDRGAEGAPGLGLGDTTQRLPQAMGVGGHGGGRPPIGPGATVRGAVSGVTSGLSGLIGGAVGQSNTGGGP